MVKKTIKTIFISELLVIFTYFYSFETFMNVQVAYLSSLFIILGSAFSYRKMINLQIESGIYEEKRDLLDAIEDPHGLFDDEAINEAPPEELDLKAIVKEEKAKIKTFSVSSMKHGVRGGASAFRLVPYGFLIVGFIALKNNELLSLSVYLPSLLIGIIAGSIASNSLTD